MKLFSIKRIFAPLVYRDFCLLWIGQSISAFGNPFQLIAVAQLVLQRGGTPVDLANIMLAFTIPPALLTLLGGVITDRLDPRTIMIWSDSIRMCTSGLIAVLAFSGYLPLWLLASILVVHGAANGVFNPASASIAPRLVPTHALDGANSLLQLVNMLGTVLGAIPAGALIAVASPAFAFALNSLSFVVAVITALFIKPLSRADVSDKKKRSLLKDATEGFQYVWGFPWLIMIILIDGAAAIAAIGPHSVGLPLLANNVHQAGAQGYSLLVWSFGCGSVLGMLLPSFIAPRKRRGLLLCLIQLFEAIVYLGVAFGPLPVVALCVALEGLANGYFSVLTYTLIQTNTQQNMLGRVMSLLMLASYGFVPISLTLSGLIAGNSGPQLLFLFAGGLMLAGSVLGLLVPSLRRLD